MTRQTPFMCVDGQERIRVKTVIDDTYDLGYLAFLGAIHEDFEPGSTTVSRFRQMVHELIALRGMVGQEGWMSDLCDFSDDGEDDPKYVAAKALAARAYGFTVREGE